MRNSLNVRPLNANLTVYLKHRNVPVNQKAPWLGYKYDQERTHSLVGGVFILVVLKHSWIV